MDALNLIQCQDCELFKICLTTYVYFLYRKSKQSMQIFIKFRAAECSACAHKYSTPLNDTGSIISIIGDFTKCT